jgi:hypothetical protein
MSKFLNLISEATPSDTHTDKQKAVRYLSNVINSLAESAGETDIVCNFDVFDDAINITIHDNVFKLKLTQLSKDNISDELSEDDETAEQQPDPNEATYKRIKDLTGAADALTGGTAVRSRIFGFDPVKRLAKRKGDIVNKISDNITSELGKLRI